MMEAGGRHSRKSTMSRVPYRLYGQGYTVKADGSYLLEEGKSKQSEETFKFIVDFVVLLFSSDSLWMWCVRWNGDSRGFSVRTDLLVTLYINATSFRNRRELSKCFLPG